jgi:hypothetical protein
VSGGPDLSARRPVRPSRGAEGLAWTVLAGLLLALLAGALTFRWEGRSWFVGDEASYAMQAESVAFDFDLTYERSDYDRFLAHWGRPPEGLILQSTDGGDTITFGKPALYAIAVAPFVRVAPRHGPLVANVVYLAIALVLVARALGPVAGPAAPLWAAALGFASVAFAYTFWIHADLFLFSLAAAGLALVFREVDPGPSGRPGELARDLPEVYDGTLGELGGGRSNEPPDVAAEPASGELAAAAAAAAHSRAVRRRWLRWGLAGLLLGAVAASRPPYLVLLLPALLAARTHFRALRPLAAGALLAMGLTALVQMAAGGDWTAYGGERRGFYPQTGFPAVDFPASEWNEVVGRLGNTTWLRQGFLSTEQGLALWRWNAVYFLVGQNVGVLPYLAPLLLGWFGLSRRDGRWALPLAFLLAAVAFLAVSPFNFYGGTGAIANRYILPMLPALVFLAGRRLPPRVAWLAPVVVTLLAAPFLYPLWRSPRQFPIGEDGRYAHVSPQARRWLPYETTLSHIPGGRDVAHQGVWVKFLADGAWPEDGGSRLVLLGGATGELLVGSPVPLAGLQLTFDRKATARLEVAGATLGDTTFLPDGSVGFALTLDPPYRVHPMWWTWDPYHLYRVTLRLPGNPAPVRFAIEPRPLR